MKSTHLIIAALLLLVGTAAHATLPPPEKITVFAAASLKESLDQASALWTLRSGQDVVVSYAASSALARQIEQGAPADVFISADADWMDYLQQRHLIVEATRADLAGNRLVVVAPVHAAIVHLSLDSPKALLAALGKGGRLAVAETTAVPAGRYARLALEHRGLWAAAQPRLAQGDSVRAALAFVARGEAPLGIVYATDAQAEPQVRVVATFAGQDHPAIVYPAAKLASATAPNVENFLAFLRSDEARAVFTRAGFTMP